MRFKKLLSAALAGCFTASALLGTALPISAATVDTLVFDIQCAGSNEISLTDTAVAAGDIALDVSVYIPQNPGVNSIGLKFQVNDGEVDDEGYFHNYGFYLSSGAFASPYTFDSENGGNASQAFSALVTPEHMNVTWAYRQDASVDADAYAEAGTTAWDDSVTWAESNAFVNFTLVVPKDTPVGTYTFDIRTEEYLHALALEEGVKKTAKSQCLGAASDEELAFKSIPLTVIVAEETTTTTTTTTTLAPVTTTTTESAPVVTTTTTTESAPVVTTTTTTESAPVVTTTTTTESAPVVTTTTTKSAPVVTTTTTTESAPVVTTTTAQGGTTPSGDLWKDDYKLNTNDMYYIIGDACGKPGEYAEVPIYIYGDTGTCAIRFYVSYDPRLSAEDMIITSAERDWAYSSDWTINQKQNPFCAVMIPNGGFNATAADGAGLLTMYVLIPEDAEPGTTYAFNFTSFTNADGKTFPACEALESINDDENEVATLDVKLYGGSLTVVADDTTPSLNYDSYSLAKAGETVNLTLFNAYGDVTWSSSDESVATVDQNGFVTAVSLGNATITATNNGVDYTCALHVGLFGDVDGNGKIEASDSQLALMAAAAIMTELEPNLPPEKIAVADVDGNGLLQPKDAQCILMYFSKTMSELETNWQKLTGNPNAPTYSNLN